MIKGFELTHYSSSEPPKPCPSAFVFINGLIDFATKHQHPYLKSPFVFRGLGNADHELTPSALRPEGHGPFFETLWSINGYSDDFETPTEYSQRIAEFCVAREFYQYADRAGLQLPPLDNFRRQQLFAGNPNLADITGNIPTGTRFQWPPNDLLGILGLAQHYGLPTRLLDWSLSPLTAIYFAASSALSRLKRNDDPNSLFCVWVLPTTAVDQHFFDDAHRMTEEGRLQGRINEEHPIRIVRPPTADNPNLQCQQGVFTVVLDRRDLNGHESMPDRRPLDEIVSDYVNADVESGSERLNGFFEHFGACHLPIRESPVVLRALRQIGYSANRIFDGYNGAAKAVLENADAIDQHVRLNK